jgi:chromosome segregation ATPase
LLAEQQEEIEVLQKEVKALQAQVTQLQWNAEREASVKRSELEQDILETSFIRQAVLQQQVALVNVQSALSKLRVRMAIASGFTLH